MSLLDKQRGCLLGLAVGDALGAAVEFQSPGSFELVNGYRGGGPHGLNPGEWTDDTSMALALADSMAQVGWDLNDQAQRYADWWMHGEYFISTTAITLRELQMIKSGYSFGISPLSDSIRGSINVLRLLGSCRLLHNDA